MNYNHFKELSRNKRGLVGRETVRRRNLKLRSGRKRSESNREMKNCRDASEPLMFAGAEKAALASLQAGQKYQGLTIRSKLILTMKTFG